MRRSHLPRLIFYTLSVFWMECIVKYWCFGSVLDRGFWYTLLFCLPIGTALSFFSALFPWWRDNRMTGTILLSLLTAWYMGQTIYYTVFKTFFVLDSFSMAGDALGSYWREALDGVLRAVPALVLLILPVVVIRLSIWRPGRRLTRADWQRNPSIRGELFFGQASRRAAGNLFAAVFLLQLGAVLAALGSTGGVMSPSLIYQDPLIPELSVSKFGVMTTLRRDIAQVLDRFPAAPAAEEAPGPGQAVFAPQNPGAEPEPGGYHLLPLDLDALAEAEADPELADLARTLAGRTPTAANRYTGLFEGKNLIFITAEGFWRYAVHETYTPTLYKLANEGFVFENFYNPLWWKSTTDGEYAACTSLIPSEAVRSFRVAADHALPFCMGNQLRALGYPTAAYHNHNYQYYNRDLTHPNMGYDYCGLGSGLELTPTWPESDLEMMEQTIPPALAGERPFHHYYMTVSGHMNYNFSTNDMSIKHQAEVADLDMSEEARAYLACNMELDRALAYVLDRLEAAGELENTVICMSGDHYPYAMRPATWNEFYGGPIDRDFEIYRSTLILWSGDMEAPVRVEKPCSSLDILPTLLNLFGLPYDSRLLMGRDILSDAPGLVVFSNRSFLTDLGRYNARTDTWTPVPGARVPDGYPGETFQEVRDMFRCSVEILERDYYRYLGF